MKLGIVGLPNVGKSTLFNSLTKAGAESANYPFCTIDPNVGIVDLPDERLDFLSSIFNPKKKTPAAVKFVDIAGLIKGASQGEGLGNKFLSHIREVDAITHVVRCFDDDNITHVEGSIDPVRDIEEINLELILSDLEALTRRYEKTAKLVKVGDKSAVLELELLTKIKDLLENEKPARNYIPQSQEEADIIKGFFLITSKPVIYCANVKELNKDIDEDSIDYVRRVKNYASQEGSEVIVVCAKIEEELSQLDDEEKEMFREELGLDSFGLDKLIVAGYKTLGLISYLTAGEKEVRAWTITKGTKAPGAAGKIHTDFEKGFIKAEVVTYDELVSLGSYQKAKEAGRVRIEGKDYVVQDGDVMLFRFNV